jgi:hypothetical protein
MTRVTIYAESPAASRALEAAVGNGNGGLQVRAAAAGRSMPEAFDPREVLVVSRGLPQRDVLQILGRCWSSPLAPRLVFVDPHGDRDGSEPLELEPTCALRMLDVVERAAGGTAATSRVAVRFRPRRREPTPIRALGAEPIDAAVRQAIVA